MAGMHLPSQRNRRATQSQTTSLPRSGITKSLKKVKANA